MVRLHILIISSFLCIAPGALAANEANETLEVGAAIKTLCKRNALRKNEKLKAKVLGAFQDLSEDQRTAARAALIKAMPNVDSGYAGTTYVDAVAAVGGTDDTLRAMAEQNFRVNPRLVAAFREAVIPTLQAALDETDPARRAKAAFLLGRLAGGRQKMADHDAMQSIPSALGALLADPEPTVVAAAADALASFGKRAAPFQDQLLVVLNGPDPLARQAAVRALVRIGGRASVDALALLLTAADMPTRIACAGALASLGEKARTAAAALLAAAADESADTLSRVKALDAYAAVMLDKNIVHKMSRNHELAPEERAACQTVIDALIPLLGVADDAVAIRVAQELARFGDQSVAPLTAEIKTGQDRAKRFAAFAVAKIGKGADGTIPALLSATAGPDAKVRRNAAEALGRIGAPGAIEPLLALFDDSSPTVAFAAHRALARLAPADPRVMKAIAARNERLAAANQSQPDPDDIDHYAETDYLIGGPLAGLQLPPYPTQHGEPAGYPGCIPELTKKAKAERAEAIAAGEEEEEYTPLTLPFSPVGQAPERLLYDDSIEHWRGYMMKYLPMRSLYDRQSQLKNWVAPAIPGTASRQQERYAEPLKWTPRWGMPQPTGRKAAAVPVVRWGEQDKPITLDCGELSHGAYAVRIIAAVEEEKLQWFRKPLVVAMRVNNGLNGEEQRYVKRVNYCSQFFAMCEMVFPLPETRNVSVTLSVEDDTDDAIQLLVHNISLDDCLSGVARRAIKTKMTMHQEDEIGLGKAAAAQWLAEERELRDRWLWEQFPPANAQVDWPEYRLPEQIRGTVPGVSNIKEGYGAWSPLCDFRSWRHPFGQTPKDPSVFAIDHKLSLAYRIEDLRANKPLPDPYPVKDAGYGRVWPDADGGGGQVASPIGAVVNDYYRWYPGQIHVAVDKWCETGEDRFARDAAMALARWAYAFPMLVSQNLTLGNMLAEQGRVGRPSRFYKCETNCSLYKWYTQYARDELDDYDRLYPYLADNWEVAYRVGQFVPWVKTPRDVIKLIDTHLIQHTAKRILRYQWHTGEMKPARLASVLGDNSFTDPWMEFLFTRTFVYPLPVSGLPDLMVSGCTREGTEYVASTAYGGGENALPKAAALVDYLEAGGNTKYNLADPERYPKPLAVCYWLLERHVAGLNHLRIGDVTGPDKHYGLEAKGLSKAAYWGWRWGKDPIFAWILVDRELRRDFTEEEWAAIEKAAATIKRPPWLDQPSRALPQWAAILETGRQHDDRLFRRTVALRAGMGWGHHHNDGLDLQVYAHGTMMTCDGGQRPGYSRPADRSTRMHNLVEVDGLGERDGDWYGHNWIRTLSDSDGVKYAMLQAAIPEDRPDVSLYRRQTALCDVDEGKGARPWQAERDDKEKAPVLGEELVTPNSYVFDVFRVAGGKRHSYNFHATLSDKVEHNLADPVAVQDAPAVDQTYLARMAGERIVGDAPEDLTLTWTLQPNQVAIDLPKAMRESDVPPYFTRLHVPGMAGARVLRGALNCTKWGYQIPMVFVQRRAANENDPEAKGTLESAFAAVIEPYVETPFVETVKRLVIEGNETDARRAVAVAVTTVNGHEDICFADGRPEKTRTVGPIRVAGEFAYHSVDAAGLRQASLTGGARLESEHVLLAPAAREFSGTVTDVDYTARTMTIDTPWPARAGDEQVFEVGIRNHWTCYTAVDVRPEGKGSVITVKRGADLYLSRVKEIDEESNTVICSLGFPYADGAVVQGLDRDWVASNESRTKWWRAEYQSGNVGLARFKFKLTGPKASMTDFGRSGAFRLWEYGPGDTVRHRTEVSLTRKAAGIYKLEADVDCRVGLRGTKLSFSPNGRQWRPLAGAVSDGLFVASVTCDQLADGTGYLRSE